MRTHRRYAANRNAVLHSGSSIDLLRTLPNDSVNLTITSPPYCMGKDMRTPTKSKILLKRTAAFYQKFIV